MTAETQPGEIGAIVRSLTKAQKRALCDHVRSIGNPERIVLCGEIVERRMIPTMTALTRVGILERGRFGPSMLTPLGIAVRNHLLKEEGNA